MTSPHITSVYGSAEAEYTIKKSRFLAHLKEVSSEEEASAFIESRRKEFWDARHNCYAYQIGPGGTIQKSSDDGEPSGTAGRPMLKKKKKKRDYQHRSCRHPVFWRHQTWRQRPHTGLQP